MSLRIPSSRVVWVILAAACTLCVSSIATFARAHARSTSYARWELRLDGGSVVARVSLLDLSRLGAIDRVTQESALVPLLTRSLRLVRGGRDCTLVHDSARSVPAEPGWVALTWRVHCAATGTRSLHAELFAREAAGHLHFASVRDESGRVRERVLSEGARDWTLDSRAISQRTWQSIVGFLLLGIRHILSGPDHLAFLLALALPWRSWRALLLAITGFTLGHAASVVAAIAGSVQTSTRAVESLIGWSVAMVAAENLWIAGERRDPMLLRAVSIVGLLLAAFAWLRPDGPALAMTGAAFFALCTGELLARGERAERLRIVSAALFGLVHGFGFAGALSPLELSKGHLAVALVGFNLGVESGQLLALGAAAPALWWLARRSDRTRVIAIEITSAGLVAVGVFWCVSRAFG